MKSVRTVLFRCLFALAFLLSALQSSASHIYGADLFYTHISGNTYKVTLRAYGDCAGSVFPALATSSPTILVTRDATNISYTTLNLTLEAPGLEVSPVCASQLSSTACNGGTNPGVKQFTYSAQVTLNNTSNLWKFRFNGTMGAASSAGRSNSITNVATGTTLGLEATLNRSQGANSSPNYTTIPTPFFCVNKPQGYNPGAIDPNADSLSFSLVTGLNSNIGNVSYNFPYTATNPLATSVAMVFSALTGQINFTPNITQQSLVVSQVTEYKNGQVVGTSMREMTFVVLSSCNNTAPAGIPTAAVNATIKDSTTLRACGSAGTISFSLNPTDANNDSIDVTYAGLPAGATLTISGNGTTAPLGSFSWNVTGVAAGDYTFFVTYTDRGCPLSSKRTTAYTIHIDPVPTYTYALQTAATCGAKGIFTLTPNAPDPRTVLIKSGTVTVLSYTNRTTDILDSLLPGTYTVLTTDTAGCTSTLSFTLAAPTPITATTVATAPLCRGAAGGTLSVTPVNATAPYEFSFNNGVYGPASTFSGLTPGTYNVKVRDAQGCLLNTNVVVPDTPDMVAGFTRALPPCNAFASGQIILNASNGIAPYTYALGSSAYGASGTFSGLAAGTYVLHIKDGRGCIKDTTVLLPDSIRVTAQVTVDSVQCFGNADGKVTLVAGGANAPYTYAQGTGAFGNSGLFAGLPAGPETFHIKDANGCFLDTTVTVKAPSEINAILTPAAATCFGIANGQIAVVASGGSGVLAYSLDGITYSSGSTFTGLPAGSYTVRVKDSKNCIKTFSNNTITQPTALVLSYVAVQPLCNGAANGSLTLSGSGATPGYTYALGSGAYGSNNAFTGLTAGPYLLRIKDTKGCTTDSTYVLGQPARVGMSVSVKQNTCNSLSNGVVNLTGTGGVSPYTFSKNGSSFFPTASFSSLPAGTFIFQIKDAKGCIKDTTLTIIDSIVVKGTVSTTNALCRDSASGTITLVGSNGVTPYTYTFNGSLNNASGVFTGLPAQLWPVRITDALGCLFDTAALIGQPQKLHPQLALAQPACFGNANGIITLSATGGTSPFRYGKNGSTPANATAYNGLAAGVYAIKVVDTNGCTADTTVTLTNPTQLFITQALPAGVSCFGDANGTVQVIAAGGTAPYTYAADAGIYGASSTISSLTPGVHVIRVKDSRGCTRDTTVTITQPERLGIRFALTNPTCEGFADGGVEWEGTGGTQPYQFAIDGSSFGPAGIATALAAGNYTLHIKDAQGCVRDVVVKLEGYPVIRIEELSMTPVRCFGESNGSVLVRASGGVGALHYQLTAPLPQRVVTADARIDSLAIGTYRFTVIDEKGCRKDTSATVTQPEELQVTPGVVLNDCIGYDDNGVLKAAVKGGTPPYKYLWQGAGDVPEGAAQVRGVPNGDYAVRIIDTNGCTTNTTLKVTYDNCCKPFIPTAFTPNNDGRNDTWQVLYKGDMELERAAIYNRFGQLVFESKSKMQVWDGSFGGQMAELGTYYFHIKLKCGNTAPALLEFKGDITLIR